MNLTNQLLKQFPETATAIGVRFDSENNVDLTAPCGIEVLINLIVKLTIHFQENASKKVRIYEDGTAK